MSSFGRFPLISPALYRRPNSFGSLIPCFQRDEIEAKLGNKTQVVNKDHTLVIPPNTPHGFKNTGKTKAKILTFFPIQNPFDHTHYLEGSKPK